MFNLSINSSGHYLTSSQSAHTLPNMGFGDTFSKQEDHGGPIPIILLHIFARHFDAIAADDFEKHSDKNLKNLHKR